MTTILDRKNLLPRPSIANIDLLLLTIPLKKPNPDLNVLDKMLTIATLQEIDVEIIFTKYDLDKEKGDTLSAIYAGAGYQVSLSQPNDEDILNRVRDLIKGKFLCLAGPSGAGKSTLLNNLAKTELMPTGEISRKMQRGKHTTRHVELFYFNDGYISDTPGFSSLELDQAGVNAEDLVFGYPEILELQTECQFGNSCNHINEPNCAVKDSSDVNPGRLDRYQKSKQYLDSVNSYERKKY